MAEPLVTIERDGATALLTLNRPDAMNALSRGLRAELVRTFDALRADEEVGVVILTGAGRAFCAGLDLKELGGEEQGDVAGEVLGPREIDVSQALRNFDRPIIGAINGVAITGGFELALECDLLIASTNARFADTHGRVGILPGWGLSQKLSRTIGIYRAKELSLTGNFLSAQQAEDWGLVNRVVEPDALLDVCRELANDMASCDPATLRGIRALIDDGASLPLGEALRLERDRSREHMKSVTPDAVRERREKIQARGRRQTG